LGFNLSVDSPAFAAHPCYRDLTTNEKLEINDHFVEHLTHKSYFVQAKKIKPSYNTRLEKLLSIFEQANFAGDSKTTKHFLLETDDHEIKEVLKVLHYVAVDKETRDKLDKEDYYQGAMEEMFGAKDRELADTKVKLEKAGKELGQQAQELEQKERKLEQKDRELEQQQKEIELLRKQLIENKRK
jgi:predicted RNase H-like nuclease (RuvC/YqgF family)